MTTRFRLLPIAIVATMMLAACTGGGGSASAEATAEPPASAPAESVAPSEPTQTEVEIVLAHSYQDEQPQVACGAKIIADEVAAAGVGVTIELFGQSQLGSDAERISSVVSGDIDMDIQGASALSALYAPMSAVDGAFVFDDSEHMYRFFTDPASDPLKQGFLDETGVRILGAWNTGARQFTANKAIRTPDDLQGLRMRFPPSPQFLMNAAAMGAEPVEVAYDELYLALQQGTVEGQENPLTNIKAINLPEVQDYVSMSSHQLSSNLVVMNDAKWNSMSPEQQAALQAAVEKAMVEEPKCVVDAEAAILDEFRAGGNMQVIDDVDREAFRTKAEPYLKANFTPEQVEVLDAIRSTAQ
jgi:tripartite ATP-independent transporter DctP family solute receptor